MRKTTFYKYNMTGAELNAVAQTIEWPYGFGEKFTGNVADASAHIIRNSDVEGGAYILIRREDFDSFTTLELYAESEIESRDGVRLDHDFVGRIYCEKLPA
jgi:hypothetical protein